jgi:glutathione S-transferase
MPTLQLHLHPLSSYCQKVLVAIDELGVTVEERLLNLGDPSERAAFHALWPIGKMPVLVDGERRVPESSVIIEYLQQRHAPAERRTLIPANVDAALKVRLWDRICDQHVMTPMQALTADLLRPEDQRDPASVAKAKATLTTAYGVLDRHLADGRRWLAGDAFTMADCAAMPALFYAIAYVPPTADNARMTDYFERLLARPSVARVIDKARPLYRYFPGKGGLAKRFFDPASEGNAA